MVSEKWQQKEVLWCVLNNYMYIYTPASARLCPPRYCTLLLASHPTGSFSRRRWYRVWLGGPRRRATDVDVLRLVRACLDAGGLGRLIPTHATPNSWWGAINIEGTGIDSTRWTVGLAIVLRISHKETPCSRERW